jgi:hypothetical protein
VSHRRCAQLAAWGTAWLSGTVAFDSVLDAMGSRERHRPGTGFAATELHPVGTVLTEWRRAGAVNLTLVLPVPGDVRGLPGSPEFQQLALDGGQAVVATGCALTCVLGPATPSSAGREVWWHQASDTGAVADFVDLADAEHELKEAIRITASELAQRGTSSWAEVPPALSEARRAGERLNLPDSHPARAVRVVAQAERMSALLALADADGGSELTSTGAQERAAALAPLRIAVRRALLAGYNAR